MSKESDRSGNVILAIVRLTDATKAIATDTTAEAAQELADALATVEAFTAADHRELGKHAAEIYLAAARKAM